MQSSSAEPTTPARTALFKNYADRILTRILEDVTQNLKKFEGEKTSSVDLRTRRSQLAPEIIIMEVQAKYGLRGLFGFWRKVAQIACLNDSITDSFVTSICETRKNDIAMICGETPFTIFESGYMAIAGNHLAHEAISNTVNEAVRQFKQLRVAPALFGKALA